MNELLTFIRDELRRWNAMTQARIQPFCIKHNINIVCSDGFWVCLRIFTERNIALNMYKNHFPLIWKLNASSSNKAKEELELNFKVVDLLIISYPINLLKNFVNYEYQPKEVQSQLSNMIV